MPTYRVTVYNGQFGKVITQEIYAAGALVLVSGKDPSQLKALADEEKRGAVVVNIPEGMQFEAVILPPKVTVYLSDDEKRMLISLVNSDAKMSVFKNMHLLKSLSKKRFVTWSAKEGWQTTKDGRDRAADVVRKGFRP
jgi:hypothetical protein